VTIRKAALQIAAVVLLVLMAFNTYLAIDHLRRIQATAALSLESSSVQVGIARVRQDFTDMETGQRGYLLTDDSAYLQPYVDAKNGIATDFANLRSTLTNRPQSEQALETQLESLAASKQAEIERTIALRQQGYRHRAFQLVQTTKANNTRIRLGLCCLHCLPWKTTASPHANNRGTPTPAKPCHEPSLSICVCLR
jgi:CHASE3 domain sensor protein